MLDRTAETQSPIAEAASQGDNFVRADRRNALYFLHRIWHFFISQILSSLTRRIVFLNIAGLLALVIGILYLSQFRAGLIEAQVRSLVVQGEIIAGAIAASATVETDSITIDPDRLLELQTGESFGPSEEQFSALEFPINPERVAP
ncbi:MAG: sensor N-terminal transmembrane domain-containing protein, partial [Rhizobiales bacterium]|nr:sensor N-terminal transmembrane domain-containing protein [Hyphomicrobiales bacterium]